VRVAPAGPQERKTRGRHVPEWAGPSCTRTSPGISGCPAGARWLPSASPLSGARLVPKSGAQPGVAFDHLVIDRCAHYRAEQTPTARSSLPARRGGDQRHEQLGTPLRTLGERRDHALWSARSEPPSGRASPGSLPTRVSVVGEAGDGRTQSGSISPGLAAWVAPPARGRSGRPSVRSASQARRSAQ
jgi:hypothetical protein